MTTDETLKPCKCGKAAYMHYFNPSRRPTEYIVRCKDRCEEAAVICPWQSEAKAIKAWNTRAEPNEPTQAEGMPDEIWVYEGGWNTQGGIKHPKQPRPTSYTRTDLHLYGYEVKIEAAEIQLAKANERITQLLGSMREVKAFAEFAPADKAILKIAKQALAGGGS